MALAKGNKNRKSTSRRKPAKRKPLTEKERQSIMGKIGMKGVNPTVADLTGQEEALSRVALHRILDSMDPKLQEDMIKEVGLAVRSALDFDRGHRKFPISAVRWRAFQPCVLNERQEQMLLNVGETIPEEIWRNNLYEVQCRNRGPQEEGGPDLWHLSIKRINKEPIHDWRHLQRIKDELLGPNCEAVEIYPAKDRVVDGANQYHLWGYRDPAYRFNIGWDDPGEVDEETARKLAPNAVQRTQEETFIDG